MKENIHIREKLMEVGTALFCEHGYHGTGIKQIVDTLDIPKGSFYNYFKSKEDFAAEIVRRYADQIAEMWNVLMSKEQDDDPLAMLRNVFDLMIRSQAANRVKTGCLIGNLAGELAESSDLCRATLQSVTADWCDRVAHQLDRAQVQGTVRRDVGADELARFCWDAWEGSLLRMKIENSTEPVRRCVSLLFDFFLKP